MICEKGNAMVDKKVTIIMPIYNTGKYIKRCLDSIMRQSYENFELVIVNDGSTDNSEEIINEYINNYKDKIKYYYKENEGVAIARNYGLDKAEGDYITFIDSDDYVDENMIEKMVNKALSYDYDLTICDLLYVYEKKTIVGDSNIYEDLNNKEQIKNNMVNIIPAMCGKLIKRELFNNLRFKENIYYEDVEIYFRMYPKIDKIGILNEGLYFYIQREDSITYTYNERLYDIVNIWDDIIKYYKKNNIYDMYKEELEFTVVRYYYATFIKRLAKTKEKKQFKKGVDFVIRKLKKEFPNYKKNYYLKKFTPKNIYLKYFNKFVANIIFIIVK